MKFPGLFDIWKVDGRNMVLVCDGESLGGYTGGYTEDMVLVCDGDCTEGMDILCEDCSGDYFGDHIEDKVIVCEDSTGDCTTHH